MEVVNGTSPEHAAELAREIRDSKAPENVRQAAAALLKKFDLVGKPARPQSSPPLMAARSASPRSRAASSSWTSGRPGAARASGKSRM